MNRYLWVKAMNDCTKGQRIREAFEQFRQNGDIGSAVRGICEALGVINSIDCKLGISLTVGDGANRYSLDIHNLRSRYERRVPALVAALHSNKSSSGITRAHLGEGCSTKHHKAGFYELVERIAYSMGYKAA